MREIELCCVRLREVGEYKERELGSNTIVIHDLTSVSFSLMYLYNLRKLFCSILPKRFM